MKKYIDHAAHILLGLIFFVFGLNGFFQFLPMPELPEQAGKFMGGLAAASYFFPLLKLVETVCGLLLLIRRFVPLALVLLAPIVVHIFLFHAFLAPAGLALPIVIAALEAYLGFFVYRVSFQPLLSAKA